MTQEEKKRYQIQATEIRCGTEESDEMIANRVKEYMLNVVIIF